VDLEAAAFPFMPSRWAW